MELSIETKLVLDSVRKEIEIGQAECLEGDSSGFKHALECFDYAITKIKEL